MNAVGPAAVRQFSVAGNQDLNIFPVSQRYQFTGHLFPIGRVIVPKNNGAIFRQTGEEAFWVGEALTIGHDEEPRKALVLPRPCAENPPEHL